MAEVDGTFVKLKPADDAVFAEVLGDTRFRDTEIVSQSDFRLVLPRRVMPVRARLPMAMRSVSQASTK